MKMIAKCGTFLVVVCTIVAIRVAFYAPVSTPQPFVVHSFHHYGRVSTIPYEDFFDHSRLIYFTLTLCRDTRDYTVQSVRRNGDIILTRANTCLMGIDKPRSQTLAIELCNTFNPRSRIFRVIPPEWDRICMYCNGRTPGPFSHWFNYRTCITDIGAVRSYRP